MDSKDYEGDIVQFLTTLAAMVPDVLENTSFWGLSEQKEIALILSKWLPRNGQRSATVSYWWSEIRDLQVLLVDYQEASIAYGLARRRNQFRPKSEEQSVHDKMMDEIEKEWLVRDAARDLLPTIWPVVSLRSPSAGSVEDSDSEGFETYLAWHREQGSVVHGGWTIQDQAREDAVREDIRQLRLRLFTL